MRLLITYILILILTGCSTTQNALTITSTTTDIKYVISEYPNISQRAASIKVNNKERFRELLDESESSYRYFSELSLQTIDTNELITEYLILKATYLELSAMLSETDINDTRTRLELERFNDIVVSIDRNINMLLTDNDSINTETIQATNNLAKSISGILRIVVI